MNISSKKACIGLVVLVMVTFPICASAALTASTSLTIVHVTSFFNKRTPAGITDWLGDWPSSPDAGYLVTGYREVFMTNATIDPHQLSWSTIPYPLPYAAFANGGSGMICNVYSYDNGQNFELASWDYIGNTSSFKHLERGMPDCWTGTMVHSYCDFEGGICNGRWKSNLRFSLYPPDNTSCWGIQVMNN